MDAVNQTQQMFSEGGSLATRRSRRSTAGNRMAEQLAALYLENNELPLDPDLDDVDYIERKVEEDVFDSDFQESSSEAPEGDDKPDDADRTVEDEEARERRATRSRIERTKKAAEKRQRVTFNPDVAAESSTSRPRRRVTLGAPTVTTDPSNKSKTRQSKRKTTIANRSAVANRLRSAEEKRAALPKRAKMEARTPTQAELIARALDMEEGNILEHKNYLTQEEEKRKRARITRQKVTGPLLRWISTVGEDRLEFQPPVVYNPPPAYAHLWAPGTTYRSQPVQAGYPTPAPLPATFSPYGQSSVQPPSTNSAVPHPYVPPSFSASTPAPSSFTAQLASSMPSFHTTPGLGLQPTPPTPAPPITKFEKVEKNYLVHEMRQIEESEKPTWSATMKALFGDDLDWDDLKVFHPKRHPISEAEIFESLGKL